MVNYIDWIVACLWVCVWRKGEGVGRGWSGVGRKIVVVKLIDYLGGGWEVWERVLVVGFEIVLAGYETMREYWGRLMDFGVMKEKGRG